MAVLQLDRARKRAGVTHDDIAARTGFHRTYVVHYFKGRRRPKHDLIRPACETLIAERQSRAS